MSSTEAEDKLTKVCKELLQMQYKLLLKVEKQIAAFDKKLEKVVKSNEACQRIKAVEGIGTITAVAIVSAMGNPNDFKNGRHFAAFLGLVPKQDSSGGRNRLLGITKRGNPYVRQLLVHGARSVVMYAPKKQDKRSAWVNQLKARAGANRTCVAVANKNARVIWALLKYQEAYRKAA